MPEARPSLLGQSPEEIEALCLKLGAEKYRATQIVSAAYKQRSKTFDDIPALPKQLRNSLAQSHSLRLCRMAEVIRSADETRRFLIALPDDECVESVLIPDGGRLTLCLSTQVGCAMGCRFCASAQIGFKRNLNAGEMIEEIFLASELATSELGDSAELTNVVFMGTGEPLANYDQLSRALTAINAKWGLGIGARRITVSTIGLPAAMIRFAREFPQINIAVSLHAPDDATRNQIVPANIKTGIKAVLTAAKQCYETAHREVTIEYVLLEGVNSSRVDARKLASALRGLRVNVNLIPFNEAPALPFAAPPPAVISAFREELERRGLNVHIRRSRGSDIGAACGQLRLARSGQTTRDSGTESS
ncbi:MAG TPA: 23S rRNA (adenine(2503)-C(2))-methyltransferase RlmN [Candidatus Brocadiia bacterium]|nr:23S rRNA (adenine(2503)-C(2))-methyltransferase RlmN [Candidatus Brocadiia bacterium]